MRRNRCQFGGGPGGRWPTLVLFAWFTLVLGCDSLWACPNCRFALAEAGRALGYAVGILMLMAAPFSIVAFWTVAIVRLRRGLKG